MVGILYVSPRPTRSHLIHVTIARYRFSPLALRPALCTYALSWDNAQPRGMSRWTPHTVGAPIFASTVFA